MPDNDVIVGVDLHSATNNRKHHTNEISQDQLIVRRGQSFDLTLKLRQPFEPNSHSFTFCVETGEHPSEERGTKSLFGFSDNVRRAAGAKAVWRAELQSNSSSQTDTLLVKITPPADAPIGEYTLSVLDKEEEYVPTEFVVLFNPWCPDDWVYISDEAEKQEYVLNEKGIIYKGSSNYIIPMDWDLGQFSEGMVKICLEILDKNIKHLRDAAADVSARCNPIYVSRVISAMINSNDDNGVLLGNWEPPYKNGISPLSWNGSYAILKKWMDTNCRPVKFGQCWVFAGVMCSVMRLLGIPCRVVTNFQSAHDTNKDLSIDTFHFDDGASGEPSPDSVWNFHVWVEGWMKRPDLTTDGKYDGWQALDPTPQEKSYELYCCGPAPVLAIHNGETHLKYDIPFVYAEVNADCNTWLIMADGSKQKIFSNAEDVGQNISTKAVGQNSRQDITNTYKPREGSKEERLVYRYALTRLGDTVGEGVINEEKERTARAAKAELVVRFEEVSELVNGMDVNLKLVVSSDIKIPRKLALTISVQTLKHNGKPDANIQSNTMEETMEAEKDLLIPIVVPFSAYRKHTKMGETISVTVIIKDLEKADNTYLAENRIVLKDPQISISVPDQIRVNQETNVELTFMNPVQETLKNCSLTISGSGLIKEEKTFKFNDLLPGKKINTNIPITPYKIGERLLLINFDSSCFKNVKQSRTINVLP